MDLIRWPYRADMVIRLADRSFRTVKVQWCFASDAAKPLPYPHCYGSSAYYPDHGLNMPPPGEIVETGRVRNRKAGPRPKYQPRPCPDDAAAWAGYPEG